MGFNYITYCSRTLKLQPFPPEAEVIDPLSEICAKYCVEHLTSTLLIEKSSRKKKCKLSPRRKDDEEPGEDMDSSSSSEFSFYVASPDEYEDESDNELRKKLIKKGKKYAINPSVRLPQEINEHLLTYVDKNGSDFPRILKPLFCNVDQLPLGKINLRSSTRLTDELLAILMRHNPRELDIHGCPKLTVASLDAINEFGSNLTVLVIGNSSQILPDSLQDFSTACRLLKDKNSCDGLIKTPNLTKLVIWNLRVTQFESFGDPASVGQFDFWKMLMQCFIKNLKYLDLGGCSEFRSFAFLEEAVESLEYLGLYRVKNQSMSHSALEQLKMLEKLKHLDISRYPSENIGFSCPDELLSSLVQAFPNLQSLDISGTNLAGRGIHVEESSKGCATSNEFKCDIPGLTSRVNRPLEYLGLYNTRHDAAQRHHIPAKKISGDGNEAQVRIACQMNLDRQDILQNVLNDMFHMFSDSTERDRKDVFHSLDLILEAMNRHRLEKHIQISGSASLFYIVKNHLLHDALDLSEDSLDSPRSKRFRLTTRLKQHILTTLVTGMLLHKYDRTLMRNGCLTILHFQIPQDVLFIYAKLVKLLLGILKNATRGSQHEHFVERIAIYLLNSLACQVDGWRKRLVGRDLGAVNRLLRLISDRLGNNVCDEVMEIAWSTMWNVTDETPENCRKFLDGNGMKLFLDCLKIFPNRPELLRNMMGKDERLSKNLGLLGNIAEVASLREQLMTKEFISIFYDLLDSTQDNIEVSYNAAGVLAHILSDGVEAWTICDPNRESVLLSMKRNIVRWDIESPRNINYRSFEPILRLLKVTHTAECQLWAAWALANLTKVYPVKYVPLLKAENGPELLNEAENVLIADGILLNYDENFSHLRYSTKELLYKYIDIAKKNIEGYSTT